MSLEDFPLFALAETTKSYVKKIKLDENNVKTKKKKPKEGNGENLIDERTPLLKRLPSAWKPNFEKLRKSLSRVSCMRKEDEEEFPIIYSRKSIDIRVGFARRASHFIFTRKQVCVHPYHPYTPKQTTRKIYIATEEH